MATDAIAAVEPELEPDEPRWSKRVEYYHPPLTVEQFLALPEPDGWHGKRELVDGVVVVMAPVGIPHMLVQHAVDDRWRDAVRANGGPRTGGLVTYDVHYRLVPGRVGLRAPDVAFVGRARYAGSYRVESLPVPPDLAVEVMSKDDTWEDMTTKAHEYLAAGVARVWVLDVYAATRADGDGVPARRFAAEDDGRVEVTVLGPDDLLDARPFLDVVLRLGDLFAAADVP